MRIRHHLVRGLDVRRPGYRAGQREAAMTRRSYRELNCPRCRNRCTAVLADHENKDATCIWCGAWLRTRWYRDGDHAAVEWKHVEVDRE